MSTNIFNQKQAKADIIEILPILSDEKLSTNVPLIEYGADSLDIVNLLIKMEEKYQVRFNLKGLTVDSITINSLSNMLSNRKTANLPVYTPAVRKAESEKNSIVR